MANPNGNSGNFITKAKDFFKSLIKWIKFFMTMIGKVIAILLLVIFVVLLFQIIKDIIAGSIKELRGQSWNYDTYTEDKQYLEDNLNITSIVKEIDDSGYGSMIDSKNYQNFKAFEYAVLMDAAEYLRTNKQEMFDIAANEGDYAFERSLMAQRKPQEYQERIKALSKKYANVGGTTGEDACVKLLETSYITDQSLVDKDKLEVLTTQVDENANENELLNVGAVKGGNNRVKGPYITYEFKGYNGTGSGKNNTPSTLDVNNEGINYTPPTNTNTSIDSSDYDYGDYEYTTVESTIIPSGYDTVDESRLSKSAKEMYKQYGTYIKQYAKEYGLDPYLIIAMIMKESQGKNVVYNQPPSNGKIGLMGLPFDNDKTTKFEVYDAKNTKKTIDKSFGRLKSSAKNQIEAGTAYLRKCISNMTWNVYKGINAYAGVEKADYYLGLMSYYYGESGPWVIGTDSYKYYYSKESPVKQTEKVYADVDTGKEKRTSSSSSGSNNGKIASGYLNVDKSKFSNDIQVAWNKYSSDVMYVAEKYGIDPMLIMAMIMQESSGTLNKKIPSGISSSPYAYGLMQICSDFGKPNRNFIDLLGNTVTLNCTEQALEDKPRAQIEAGTAVLREKLKIKGWDIKEGINAYLGSEKNFNRIKKRLGDSCEEVWVIVKENGKYVKHFLNLNTGAKRSVEVDIKTGEDIAGTEEYESGSFDNISSVDLTGGGVTPVDTTVTADGEAIITGSTVEETVVAKTSGSEALEPYIYIIKEDIDFSYYIDNNNTVIQYPLLLNANNAKLNVGQENGEEIKRALLGMMPVVWPEDDSSAYTRTPYYSDVTTPTVYKIPLRTILGRYLPKQELLLSWSILKQNVDKELSGGTAEKDFMDYVIDSIKGIYNEACLSGEKITPLESEEDDTDTGTESIKYTDENTHTKTFVSFAKVGLETTKYDINGLLPLTSDDGERTVKVVTDFVNAVIIKPNFSASYSYNYTETAKDVGVDGNATLISTTHTKSGSKTYSLSSLGTFGAIQGEVVLANGNPTEGYIPPSSTDGEIVYYIEGATEDEVSTIRQSIINAIKKTIKGDNVSVSLPSDVVRYNPVFLISDPIQVAKKMKIVHTRMPALLVTSATTWCRDVSFEHNIVQNQFKQNRAAYIQMNSKMGTGITVFETKAVDNGYRGKAYSEVFSRLQEKDLVNMLLQLESVGKEGFSDAYEYMRDLYRLAKVSQQYSVSNNIETGDSHFIHPDTYKHVYVPESITKYNDLESQKIYWLNLLTATSDAPMKDEEIRNFRTRNKPLSWQMVEYDKYDECNTTGVTKVYALSPFASPYLRTYYETMFENNLKVDGCFGVQDHSGADWAGRKKINDILESGKSATSNDTIGQKIYDYEYGRLTKVLTPENAKNQLQKVLKEQTIDNPIVAVAPGIVERVAYSARAGFYVRIKHSEYNGACSYYVHLKRWPEVSVGDYVGAGTIIGYEGDTGRSFGSHLHFQLKVEGDIKSPAEYIFPTFNPFYYEEKAAEVGYALEKDYMSLERTVRMVSSRDPKIENRVPNTELVDDYTYLILNQGKIERPEKYSGNLNWSKNYDGDSAEGYVKYLDENKFNDLYLEAVFFDKELAYEKGLLDTDQELFGILFGNIIVKTDMASSLPALTEEELRTIINTWIPARYNEEDAQWLIENVFTDETIKTIIAYQNQYNVSAVFALAVATQEQQMGLCDNALSREAFNIFSIKGEDSENGYIEYQEGKHWKNYGSYGRAFADFMELIAQRGPYFKSNRYTIGAIAVKYCEGNTWGKAVSNIVLEIMNYYTGKDWSMPAGTARWAGDNSTLLGIIKSCMAFYVDNGYKYCQASGAGRLIPPCDNNGNVIQQKHVCSSCSKNCSSQAYRTDCSTYVSWVIYEFAKLNGYTDLQNEFSKQHSSYTFKDIGQKLNRGDKSGYLQYFEIVKYGIPGNNFKNIESELQPGDILVYREGDGHHVEFVSEEGTKVYTCGSNPSSKEPTSSYTRRSDATCAIRLIAAGGTTAPISSDHQGNGGQGVNAGEEKTDGIMYGGTARIGDLSFESENGLPQLVVDITNTQDTDKKLPGTNHPSWQRQIWESTTNNTQTIVSLQDELCFMAMKYGFDPVLLAIHMNKEGKLERILDWGEHNGTKYDSVGPFSFRVDNSWPTLTDVYGNVYKMDSLENASPKDRQNILIGYENNRTNARVRVQAEVATAKHVNRFRKDSDTNGKRHTAWHFAMSQHGNSGTYSVKNSSWNAYLKQAYSNRNIYWVLYKNGKFYKVESNFDDNAYIDQNGNKVSSWAEYEPMLQEIDYTLVFKNGDKVTKYKYTPDGAFYKWVVGQDFVTKYEYEEGPNFSQEYILKDLPMKETRIKLVDDSGDTIQEDVKNSIDDELYDVDKVPIEQLNTNDSYIPGYGLSTVSAGSAGEAYMQICGKVVKYMHDNGYTYYTGGGSTPNPYPVGTFATPPKGKRMVDCIRFCTLVIKRICICKWT